MRDLFDLARRFRGAGDIAPQVDLPAPVVGEQHVFEALVLSRERDVPPERKTVAATLRGVSEHAYFYVEDPNDIDHGELQDAVDAFEEEVWPSIKTAFGLPPGFDGADAGVDGDPRIVILHTDLGSSVGGYVSDEDIYPEALLPHSNQREMLYINSRVRPLGSRAYAHLVAHEFQHLLHERIDAVEKSWLNEGLSEYAGDLISRSDSFYTAFLDEPDTQLNDWTDLGDSSSHYGASSLFVSYLLERTGATPGALAALQSDGLASVRELLRDTNAGRSLEQFVSDWAVANLLDLPEGSYGYRGPEITEASSARVVEPGQHDADVHQFATDYIELRAEEFASPPVLTFDGDTEVPVVAAQLDTPGTFWWAGRGDEIDSTLTRGLDLSGVDRATLAFRTWFDIEGWFDHAYVAVSTDGGRTWQVLAGTHSEGDDPLDLAYGPSYSGRSGGGEEPVWVDERIDLTPYAGRSVLLRFEYVTDAGYTRPGWLIDDIAVPEAGFFDDGEADTAAWQREGFRRLSEKLPQEFSLRLVTFGDAPEVRDTPLDARNHAEVRLDGLGTEYNRAIVAVTGLTEGTTEPARYRYAVQTTAP